MPTDVSPFLPDDPQDPPQEGARPYPLLVIRIYSAVYQREPITIRRGPAEVQIKSGRTTVQHPEPFGPDGGLSEGCRVLLVEGVREAVQRFRFRMCVVWGPGCCTYVERDGTVNASGDQPAGGLGLPARIAFDRREPLKW